MVGTLIAIFASYGRYIFPKFIYETKIITSEYAVPQWLVINIKTVSQQQHDSCYNFLLNKAVLLKF